MGITIHWLRNVIPVALAATALSCAHAPGPPNVAQSSPINLPSLPEPSPSEPVKAAMTVRPENVSAGDVAELLVYLRIAKAHYLHAPAKSSGYAIAVTMDAVLPDGVEAAGDWIFPPPLKGQGDSLIYRDSLILRRAIRVSSRAAPQTLMLTGSLRFQACTDELCWPPALIQVSAPLVIQSKGR